MVAVACPHCEGSVDLPDGVTDVFTCLHCGGQFGYLPDEGEGMGAEIVPLAPDPNKDEPDAYERRLLFAFKFLFLIGVGLLTAFVLYFLSIVAMGMAIAIGISRM
ncbi:MAG: hypothetical protein CMB41_02365 [Euryarchaeota archaeon]|nr:hypothetical protein [Euryarchaeota archaeon]|tara:strand:- start:1065 stop:1379 length:315 start_codon:yes stop_codon:yes gene_type:complete